MSENMPDFDNMSQEEITAWLETLAKRQGASEGFTTAADMDIAEVDPDTVVIDEPGYIPYGQETAAAKPAETKAPPVPQAPVQPIAVPQAVFAPPPPEPPRRVPETKPEPPAPVEEGGLAWLASLAADQGEEIFNLDLSDLPAASTLEPSAPPAVVNPMTWLEDLARAQVAEPSLERLGADEDDEEESEKLNPYAQNADPMEWLETLAKRQGANPEELTTSASMNVPRADEAEVEEEGYQPFSFDTPPARRSPEPVDTADWLSSLAGAEGYSEAGVLATQPQEEAEQEPDDASMSEIASAINSGTVTADQMQQFLDHQAEQLAQEPDEVYDALDDDAPLAPAELPDWLSDLKPPPPTSAPEPTKPLDALFETPAVPEMPDWLRQDTLDDSITLESIFEPEETAPPFVASPEDAALSYEIEVDRDDPWVEAFDLEYEQGSSGAPDSVPAWYEQNLSDPARIAAVEGQALEDAELVAESPLVEPEAEIVAALADAALPEESELPAGQPQDVPDWAALVESMEALQADEYDDAPLEQAAADDEEDYGEIEIPDWLREVEASVSPQDVPDWLVQTISGDVDDGIEAEPEVPLQPAAQIIIEPPAAPPVQVPPPIYQPPPPQPSPARVASGEAAAVLQSARDREQSGDLEGALVEYESLIRSSADLESVVSDLTQLSKSYRTTPGVFRVLGDGLMRQGKLQAALNTYREALNQL